MRVVENSVASRLSLEPSKAIGSDTARWCPSAEVRLSKRNVEAVWRLAV